MMGTGNRPECKCRVSWQGWLTERGTHEHGARPGDLFVPGLLQVTYASGDIFTYEFFQLLQEDALVAGYAVCFVAAYTCAPPSLAAAVYYC